MAFEILTPDVGTRLLRTFGTLSEENRKRQELASNIANREAKVEQQAIMNAIREQQLGQGQQRIDNSLFLGLGNLNIRKQIEERMAQEAAVRMAEDQQKLDASQADNDARNELVGVMSMPDEQGLTLSQRLYSRDDKIAREALQAFAELDGRFAGAGKLTDAYLKGVIGRLNANRQAELNGVREQRMAQTAEANATRADRAQDFREKTYSERAAATAEKAKATQSNQEISNRLRVLNPEISSSLTQYEKRMAEWRKLKPGVQKTNLEGDIARLAEHINKLKGEREELTRLGKGGPQPGALFGSDAELPPLPDDAAAPAQAAPAPVQPSIQAVPNTAPTPAPAAAPLPTPTDVNGLDFIFSRPAK